MDRHERVWRACIKKWSGKKYVQGGKEGCLFGRAAADARLLRGAQVREIGRAVVVEIRVKSAANAAGQRRPNVRNGV